MLGWIGAYATGKWQVSFWALLGLLSLPASAWSSGDDAVKTAGKQGIVASKDMASKAARAQSAPERLARSNVVADPFVDDNNPRKDPINRAATRMVHMPLTRTESVHLNVMGQMLKLSFKIKRKATREDDAAFLRSMHTGTDDPRAAVRRAF